MTTQAMGPTITAIRQSMVSNCKWAVANNAQIHYSEHRPFSRIAPRALPFTLDCSGFATTMARWSGAADPGGSAFNGWEDTTSILAHSPHIPRAETQPGDYVLMMGGPNKSHHVVVLLQSAAGGNGALCVSHGGESGPLQEPLSKSLAAHPGATVTFARLLGPGSGNPYCPVAVDGTFGGQTIKALQWKLGVSADGTFGPTTKKALQSHLGVPADGSIGPATIKALQRHVGVAQDGHWGADTTKALQRALNANTF